jgi:hypothetical protein
MQAVSNSQHYLENKQVLMLSLREHVIFLIVSKEAGT